MKMNLFARALKLASLLAFALSPEAWTDQVVPHSIPDGGAAQFLAQPIQKQKAPAVADAPGAKISVSASCKSATGKILTQTDADFEACARERGRSNPGSLDPNLNAGISAPLPSTSTKKP